jgi:dsDNA-specific endonuclease/ATPase MutS2
VIHGHGTNALRRALWKMFASHVHVEKYYQAEQYEGGAGATIVEVRI